MDPLGSIRPDYVAYAGTCVSVGMSVCLSVMCVWQVEGRRCRGAVECCLCMCGARIHAAFSMRWE